MRKIIIIAIILGLSACIPAECQAQKKVKVEYEFPGEMSESIKSQYIELANKGLAIYQVTCARCHGKKIPEFTLVQLEAYQIRMSNPKHEAELQETSLNAEELALITTFFTYKKKSEKARKAEAEARSKEAAHH